MRVSRLAPIMLTAALAGCGSFGAVGLGPMDQPRPVESDTLPPVVSAPVTKTALPPPPIDPVAETLPPSPPASSTLPPADTASLPAATGVAQPAPPAGQQARAELGRTDLLGGWTLKSGSDSCQLFMTLTSWTGGYRASTRGCQSPTLKGISAWSLSGSQVVLAGTGGAPVAQLNQTGTNRFEGSAAGQAVSFSR